MKIGPPRGMENAGMSLELVQLSELRDTCKTLQRRLDKQALLIESMWQYMKVEFELDDSDLKTMFEKLDASDGSLDGKRAPKTEKLENCPACEEPVKGVRSDCFWCGHKFPEDLFSM